MNRETVICNGIRIAVVSGGDVVIRDAASALDLLMAVRYETGADRIAIAKEAVAEEFFVLSSGLAGEVLQKFINYRMKLAVWGDYSRYTSKPLHDFIYESNNGKDVFFADSRDAAIRMLSRP